MIVLFKGYKDNKQFNPNRTYNSEQVTGNHQPVFEILF